ELQVFCGTNNVARGVGVAALDTIEAGRWAKAYLVDGYDSRKSLGAAPEEPKAARRRAELQETILTLETQRTALVDALLDEKTKAELQTARRRLDELKHSL